ncbi:hypothetical protein KS4_35260 [Poriferisphaera corsica]|uniref:Uncharacterized protein n=1 Tax=Poriferisphaera corsica TaxID=2528020 RepID=A0A517YYZ5_9BACT|nr:hypothetical protein [Poriferisphaera corsica]QDU35445.1 hypothetical protein KS4_35260 [Poriferisphaera corsica]
MPRSKEESSQCPFINAKDSRCASRFNLAHLSEAFHICLNNPMTCPTYQKMTAEQSRKEKAVVEVRTQSITIQGKACGEYRDARFGGGRVGCMSGSGYGGGYGSLRATGS